MSSSANKLDRVRWLLAADILIGLCGLYVSLVDTIVHRQAGYYWGSDLFVAALVSTALFSLVLLLAVTALWTDHRIYRTALTCVIAILALLSLLRDTPIVLGQVRRGLADGSLSIDALLASPLFWIYIAIPFLAAMWLLLHWKVLFKTRRLRS